MARPVKPNVVRDFIQRYAQDYDKAQIEIDKGIRGAVQKHICTVWPEENQRHRCVGWLFDIDSIRMSALSDSAVLALKRWIGAVKIENEWVPARGFTTEAEWIDWASQDMDVPGTETQPEPPKNTMLKIDGVTIRCPECGANVFTKLDDGRYSCNGCRALYVGEKEEPVVDPHLQAQSDISESDPIVLTAAGYVHKSVWDEHATALSKYVDQTHGDEPILDPHLQAEYDLFLSNTGNERQPEASMIEAALKKGGNLAEVGSDPDYQPESDIFTFD